MLDKNEKLTIIIVLFLAFTSYTLLNLFDVGRTYCIYDVNESVYSETTNYDIICFDNKKEYKKEILRRNHIKLSSLSSSNGSIFTSS